MLHQQLDLNYTVLYDIRVWPESPKLDLRHRHAFICIIIMNNGVGERGRNSSDYEAQRSNVSTSYILLRIKKERIALISSFLYLTCVNSKFFYLERYCTTVAS